MCLVSTYVLLADLLDLGPERDLVDLVVEVVLVGLLVRGVGADVEVAGDLGIYKYVFKLIELTFTVFF